MYSCKWALIPYSSRPETLPVLSLVEPKRSRMSVTGMLYKSRCVSRNRAVSCATSSEVHDTTLVSSAASHFPIEGIIYERREWGALVVMNESSDFLSAPICISPRGAGGIYEFLFITAKQDPTHARSCYVSFVKSERHNFKRLSAFTRFSYRH